MSLEILPRYDPESHEQPFAGRTILITGGAAGTGLETATHLHGLGAEIIIGTRNPDSFSKVTAVLGNKKVFPFIADLTDEKQVEAAMKTLRKYNIQPTDIIHSAAGGMEGFFKELLGAESKQIYWTTDKGEKERKLDALRKKIIGRVNASMPAAEWANFEGPRRFLEQMIDILPLKSIIIYYSSLWSSIDGQPGANVPEFYKSIAYTKNLFEKQLEEKTSELVRKGIYPAIISGHLIKNSATGRAIDILLGWTSPESKKMMENTYIEKDDMVKATLDVLQSDPKKWKELPLRRFVTSEGISDRIPQDHPIFKLHLPI